MWLAVTSFLILGIPTSSKLRHAKNQPVTRKNKCFQLLTLNQFVFLTTYSACSIYVFPLQMGSKDKDMSKSLSWYRFDAKKNDVISCIVFCQKMLLGDYINYFFFFSPVTFVGMKYIYPRNNLKIKPCWEWISIILSPEK